MTHFKTSVVEVKAEDNCLPNALIIAIAKVENDPEYVAYRRDFKIRAVVQNLAETGIDLSVGVGIPELIKFHNFLGNTI